MKQPILTIALGLMAAGPLAADTPKFGTEATVEVLSTLTLSSDQKVAFENFSEDPRYFGAFFINPFGSHSFRVSDYGSLKAARDTAENRCNTDASPSKCTLYAVTVPKGQNPQVEDLVGFSHGATIDFNDEYLPNQREGRFGAFVITKSGSYGYTWDWPSKEEAEASAVLFCQSDVFEKMANVFIAERAFSKDAGFTDCKIVHSYSSN